MTKTDLVKLEAFILEVKQLPDKILSDEDARLFNSDNSENEKTRIISAQDILFEKTKDIIIRLLAYFRAVTGENSTYVQTIKHITFRPKTFAYNTTHWANNDAWLKDKNSLLNLLKLAQNEFKEKIRIKNETQKSSKKPFFSTTNAKTAILTGTFGIVGILITVEATKLESCSSKSEQYADSIVINDKKRVVNSTTIQIFKTYYETAYSLKDNYVPISAYSYIREYADELTGDINKKIDSSSYINRYAQSPSLWSEKDIQDVNTQIRKRTINRINEIFDDVELNARGPFIVTEDKLKILLEQIKTEAEREQ